MRSPRAEKYRQEAARLQDEAVRAKHPEIRQQLLDIAAQYDWLATTAGGLLHSNRDTTVCHPTLPLRGRARDGR